MLQSADRYAYAPAGWATKLPAGSGSEEFWAAHIARAQAACEAHIAHSGRGHWVSSEHGGAFLIFAYVLALAGRDRQAITILDYGGGLGEHYWVGRALVPELTLAYHCKELPAIADAGRALTPAATWHTDDACLLQQYDLVMFCSSLQYVQEWKDTLRRAASASRRYVFLSDLPTVHAVETCVATQRSGGVTNLHWLLNRNEVLQTVEGAGLRLIQDFAMGAYPTVAHAPEQPACAGWLFERESVPVV